MARSKREPLVGIVCGSASDREVMREAAAVLDEFGVSYVEKVLSAHRSPHATREFALNADKSGIRVVIAGAGLAAHLAGVIASHTTLPVIGVPMASGPLAGFDALLSTVQMPGGVPVAAVSVGKAGAKNAALLAIEILALSDARLKKALSVHRARLAKEIESVNKNLI